MYGTPSPHSLALCAHSASVKIEDKIDRENVFLSSMSLSTSVVNVLPPNRTELLMQHATQVVIIECVVRSTCLCTWNCTEWNCTYKAMPTKISSMAIKTNMLGRWSCLVLFVGDSPFELCRYSAGRIRFVFFSYCVSLQQPNEPLRQSLKYENRKQKRERIFRFACLSFFTAAIRWAALHSSANRCWQ